jgi:hypothetical protein
VAQDPVYFHYWSQYSLRIIIELFKKKSIAMVAQNLRGASIQIPAVEILQHSKIKLRRKQKRGKEIKVTENNRSMSKIFQIQKKCRETEPPLPISFFSLHLHLFSIPKSKKISPFLLSSPSQTQILLIYLLPYQICLLG